MNSLCRYKNIFGKIKEGPHQYRLFNIAIIDVLLTILVAYFISKFTKYHFKIVLIILFILGIITHRLFCVKTTVDNFLFTKFLNVHS